MVGRNDVGIRGNHDIVPDGETTSCVKHAAPTRCTPGTHTKVLYPENRDAAKDCAFLPDTSTQATQPGLPQAVRRDVGSQVVEERLKDEPRLRLRTVDQSLRRGPHARIVLDMRDSVSTVEFRRLDRRNGTTPTGHRGLRAPIGRRTSLESNLLPDLLCSIRHGSRLSA